MNTFCENYFNIDESGKNEAFFNKINENFEFTCLYRNYISIDLPDLTLVQGGTDAQYY